MTVRDVLSAHGFEVPARGRRMRCPVHGGENPQAFSFTDDGLWTCFACGAGGDIFTLVERLRGVQFVEAVRVLAQLAGLDGGKAPLLDAGEYERRQRIVRRRRALRTWRDDQLNRYAADICTLTSDAQWLSEMLIQARVRKDISAEELYWRAFEDVQWALAETEWIAAQLECDDEVEWARLWLLEKQRGVEGRRWTTAAA